MESYKDSFEGSRDVTFISNKELIEKELKDDYIINSTTNFMSFLESLQTFHDFESFDEETDIYVKFIKEFEGKKYFPVEKFEESNFMNIVTAYIRNSSVETSLEITINVINCIINESDKLFEQFIKSDIFNIFLSAFKENDAYFTPLLHIFSLSVRYGKDVVKRMVTGDFTIFDKIESKIIEVEGMQNFVGDVHYDCIRFFSYCVKFIDNKNIGYIGYINAAASYLVVYIEPEFEDIDIDTYVLVSEGIQRAAESSPDTIGIFCQYEIIKRIDGMLCRYGPSGDNKCMKLTSATLDILLSITRQITRICVYDVEELPSFIDTLKKCCLHDNSEIARKAIKSVINLIENEEITPRDLIEFNFQNEVLIATLSESSFKIKEYAMLCLYETLTVASQEEFLELITEDMLEILAEIIIDSGKERVESWIDLILFFSKQNFNIDFFNAVRLHFQVEQFNDLLLDIYDDADDNKLKEKIMNIVSTLGLDDDDDED